MVSSTNLPCLRPLDGSVTRDETADLVYCAVARAWGIDEKALPAASIDNAIKVSFGLGSRTRRPAISRLLTTCRR